MEADAYKASQQEYENATTSNCSIGGFLLQPMQHAHGDAVGLQLVSLPQTTMFGEGDSPAS